MYRIIRIFLFFLEPETAHNFVTKSLKRVFGIWGVKNLFKYFLNVNNQLLEREICGIKFKNPVGLAAGFDKNAEFIEEMSCCGFGFVEIGTVTPLPQPGNDSPRMFRLEEDEALINRMGFNNLGVDVVAARLKSIKRDGIIIGGNIGKNKTTPNERALDDYVKCLDVLYDVVDYFVVNVSSPNTPNLRELQEKEPLKRILNGLQQRSAEKSRVKPIFLKIAPDLTDAQLDDIVDIVLETNLSGVIATNTTVARKNLKSKITIIEQQGGLSGKPLFQRSTEIVCYLSKRSQGKFPIIAVGGIHHENDALEKLKSGASLVQVYTGFIYEGPSLVKRINKKILNTSC